MSSLIEWLLSPFAANTKINVAEETLNQSEAAEAVVTPTTTSSAAPSMPELQRELQSERPVRDLFVEFKEGQQKYHSDSQAVLSALREFSKASTPVPTGAESSVAPSMPISDEKEDKHESDSADLAQHKKPRIITGTAVLVGTARACLDQPGAMAVFGFEGTAETPSTERPSGSEKAKCIVNRYFRLQAALREQFVHTLVLQLRHELTDDEIDNVFDEMDDGLQDEIVKHVREMQPSKLLQDCKRIEEAVSDENDVPELVESFEDVRRSESCKAEDSIANKVDQARE